MKDSTFKERFDRWKNGESYWDIVDKPLAKYGNGKDYDGYNIQHVKQGSFPSYKTGKDLLFKTEGLPWQQKLKPGFYNNARVKQLHNYFNTAQKYMPKKELIALLPHSERPYYRDEYGTHLASRIIPVSNTDPIGEFVVANAILNKPLQGLSSIINNTVTNSAISKAILKNIGNYKSDITPLIRTKIGDVEVDNPLLYYRLGSLEIGDAFNRTGIVESEDGGYGNPMFAQGRLWYGIPKKETLEPIPVKDNKWGLDFSKDNEVAPKTHLLISNPSTKMTGANNHSGKMSIRIGSSKLYPITENAENINTYGKDFINSYNNAYYKSELGENLVTKVVDNTYDRRIPEFSGAANKDNTTLYKFDPEYGYKKYDNTPTYKYKGGKDSISSFVSTFRPMLYNTLLKRGYHTNSMDNMLTQLAWESNYGKSNNAKSNYNYGGVKSGSDYAKYNSPEDFVDHYVDLIHDKYPNAFNSNDLNTYAKALKLNGYYEDSLDHYSSSLNNMKSLRYAIEKERLGNTNKYNSDLSFDLIMSQPQDAIRSYKQDIILDVPVHTPTQQTRKQIIYPSYVLLPNKLPNIMDVYSNMINGRPLLNMPGQ